MVAGAFDVPFRHLAFDESRVGPFASDGVEAVNEEAEGVAPVAVSVLRGKKRAPEQQSGARCEERQ